MTPPLWFGGAFGGLSTVGSIPQVNGILVGNVDYGYTYDHSVGKWRVDEHGITYDSEFGTTAGSLIWIHGETLSDWNSYLDYDYFYESPQYVASGSGWNHKGNYLGTFSFVGAVGHIIEFDGKIWVSGNFPISGATFDNGVKKLMYAIQPDGSGGMTLDESVFGSGVAISSPYNNEAPKCQITALGTDGNNLYVNSVFNSIDGLTTDHGLFKYDGTTWSEMSSSLSYWPKGNVRTTAGKSSNFGKINGGVNTISVYDSGDVFLGGDYLLMNVPAGSDNVTYTTINSWNPYYLVENKFRIGKLCRLNVSTGNWTYPDTDGSAGTTSDLTGIIFDSAIDSSQNVYVAGYFTTYGTQSVYGYCGKWDGSTGSTLDNLSGGHPSVPPSGVVYTTSVCVDSNDDAYFGGLIPYISGNTGSTANHIVKWNNSGNTWEKVGHGDPNEPNELIMDIKMSSSGDIYILQFDGIVRKWDGSSWSYVFDARFGKSADSVRSRSYCLFLGEDGSIPDRTS